MTTLLETPAPPIPELSWVPEPEEPDNAVVLRVLAGEKCAFGKLAERYSQRIFRICMAVTKDRDAAEDCLQRTFILALENLSQYRAKARFSTWLTRIALNVAFSHLRQTSRRQPFASIESEAPSLNLVDRSQNPEAACFRRELRGLDRKSVV